MKENSEKENSKGKAEENSAISTNSNNKVEEESTTSKSREDFLKKMDSMFPTRKSERKDNVGNLEDKTPKGSEEQENEVSKDQDKEHDPHAFPMLGDFISFDK